jgi:hypothetical protein
LKHVFYIPKHVCLPEDWVHDEHTPYDEGEVRENIADLEDKIKGVEY